MNFSKLTFAVMMLLNGSEAVKVEQKAAAEVAGGNAPGQVLDLSQFLLNTCAFKNGKSGKNLNKSFKWNSGKRYETEFWHMEGDAIRMSVPLYGARTGGTKNPRMELSETLHWPLPQGNNRMKVTAKIQKTIPGVNFDLGQILRDDGKIKMASGKKCPLHVQIEYQTDSNKIFLKSRGAECKFKKIKLPGDYNVGEEFSYELAVVDGIMTFTTSKGDSATVDDFNFLSHEYDARGEKGYFKAGVYIQKSCSTLSDPSQCDLGEGPDDLTIVDFKDLSVTHE